VYFDPCFSIIKVQNLIFIFILKKDNMVQLVIVESPAKCQKIQGFLGAGWRVIASMGHIRALKHELEAVGIHKNFEPSYEFSKTKAKAIKQIKEEAAHATEVYLAADDDREGESIAYSVCLLLKLNPATALRSVFHEITETAVKKAIAEPRRLDMNRVHAQQARAMLDMLLGFTLSPLLWRYVGPALSAGRCQTPALRLVVEREDQIRNFTSSSSWHLHTQWTADGFTFPAEMEDDLEDKESAVNYMETIYTQPQGHVIETNIKPWTESAPLPLITSTLQQQASALFSMNPKQTMASAQRLYEAGHITYMRTDHAVLSEEAKKDAQEWVKTNYGEAFISAEQPPEPAKKKKPKVGKKEEAAVPQVQSSPAGAAGLVQEAHEAIRPTHMDKSEIEDANMTAYEKKVYRLIWQRAIQSVMSPVQGETCRIKTQIDGDSDFTWGSQWKHTTFEGWRRAGKVANVEEEEEEEPAAKDAMWEKAIALKNGDAVTWNTMKAMAKETKAQGRYTEATLVRELEKYGIGRPSTFASLLSAIQDKQYVEITDIPARDVSTVEYTLTASCWPAAEQAVKKKVGAEKKKLVPTDLGRSSLTFLLKHFSDIFEYDVTSHMEKRLDKIAEGVEPWKQILQDNWGSYKERYETLLQGGTQDKSIPNPKVREFSNGLKAVQSKKGPLLLIEGAKTEFIGWPEGVAFDDITEEAARAFHTECTNKKQGDTLGMWKEQPIQKKSGKFGVYLQCGTVSIPFVEDETIEKTVERLESKAINAVTGALKEFKNYAIKNGQYGPYIIKTSIKKTQFVSLPKGLDITTLTEKEVECMYQHGVEAKKKWAKKA
jgi:DNA topoisomerase-1